MNCNLDKKLKKQYKIGFIKSLNIKKSKTKKALRKHRKWKNANEQNQEKLFKILDKIYKGVRKYDEKYYWWLPSPKGGYMQLDRYYPSLKLAFEYNGKQHYKYPNWWHKSRKEFNYQKRCDRIKKKLCSNNGVKLIIIKYNEKLNEDFIMNKVRSD